MTESIRQATDRRLRQFSILWVIFFLIVGVRYYWPAQPQYPVMAASCLAILIGVAGCFRPSIIRPIYVTWVIAVIPIAWTVSRLVLAALFYGLFIPIGLLLRLLGRDALSLKIQPERKSNWVPRSITKDARQYLQQY